MKNLKSTSPFATGQLAAKLKKLIFKCWQCGEHKPATIKRSWGFEHVCPPCENYLLDESEKREKRRHDR